MTATTHRPPAPPPSSRPRRRRAWLLALAVLVVLGVGAGVVAATYRTVAPTLTADGCTVGTYSFSTSQASVAAQMIGAVTSSRPALPRRAEVLTLAAALQESDLTDLAPGAGDRDSVGVLQQRPSQGWGGGHARRLTDVTEATREFLAALRRVPNWQHRRLADAIQAVQISADGSAYAKHESKATALAAALDGRRPAALRCSFAAPTVVAATSLVARRAARQLGIDSPVATGRRVTVPGAGWQTTTWFVANADRLGIARVDYADRAWTRTGGWQPSDETSAAVTATMARLG